MDRSGYARVTQLMDRMAGGDSAAVFCLQAEFAPQLAAALRRVLSGRGVELPRSEIEELVADLALELYEHAGGWRPEGGALPWVWAARRVANVVDRHLGQFTEELDADRFDRRGAMTGCGRRADAAGAGDEPASFAVLERIAAEEPQARLLRDALLVVAGERDRELFLEMAVQSWMGDRSPATSVGPRLGMSPEAVRQQKCRVSRRLALLAAGDERYAALADLSLVA